MGKISQGKQVQHYRRNRERGFDYRFPSSRRLGSQKFVCG